MKDQVVEATSMGLTATAMAEAKQEDIDSGKYQLVFASAEKKVKKKVYVIGHFPSGLFRTNVNK